MRTQSPAASRGDTGRGCVVLVAGVLLTEQEAEAVPANDMAPPAGGPAQGCTCATGRAGPGVRQRERAHDEAPPLISASRNIRDQVHHRGHLPTAASLD